jgi:hypothetical protein
MGDLKSNNDFRQGPFPRNGDKAQASSTLRHLGLSRKRTQGASVSPGRGILRFVVLVDTGAVLDLS